MTLDLKNVQLTIFDLVHKAIGLVHSTGPVSAQIAPQRFRFADAQRMVLKNGLDELGHALGLATVVFSVPLHLAYGIF